MLTESEISRSWRVLFNNRAVTAESVDKAEILLEELRPESPLRLRLTSELEELRLLCNETA